METENSVLKDILSGQQPYSEHVAPLESNTKDVNETLTFWDTIGTRMYSGMAAKLESDQPAYAFISNLVISFLQKRYKKKSLKGAKLVDFGCHNGSSTSLYADLTRQGLKVIGIDSNPIVIAEAQLKFSDVSGLEFRTATKTQLIPYTNIDVVLATFVHPTIATRNEIEVITKNIYMSLSPGGMYIMLGLNPQSFGGSYRSYKHELKYGPYSDGIPFRNTLVLPDGSSLSFDDYCWTNSTLTEILKSAGFSEVDIISLNHALVGNIRDLFENSLKQVESKFGVKDWKQEWGTSTDPHSGLFNIYVAFKK